MSDSENEDPIVIIITEADLAQYKRLDQFISQSIDQMSRSTVKRLFEQGQIKSESGEVELELKRMPPAGTSIVINIPPRLPADALPEDLPLDILFEDEHLVIVNKAAGMVTHPAPGNYTGTLVNAILHHCPDLKGVGDQKRPGIVHRLDKGTSGVMVVAKNQACHEGLVELFSRHDIDRIYHAIAMTAKIPILGKLESTLGRHPSNRFKMAINPKNGKYALTHYKVLKKFRKCYLLEMRLETGRTHQIRVHLQSILNAPILCDPLYSNPKEHLNRLGESFKELIGDYRHPFLHARRLGFVHPITGEKLLFEKEPPEVFQKVLALAEAEPNE